MRRRQVALSGVAAVLLLAGAQFVALVMFIASSPGADIGQAAGPGPVNLANDGRRSPTEDRGSVEVYEGHGAWVDVYDYAPAFQRSGTAPRVDAAEVDAMANYGVRTLYLQAAIDRGQAEPAVVARRPIERLLRAAHDAGMRVVAWYLPRFGDVERDMAFLEQVAGFEAGGHRFDGLAVDIEWTRSVPDPDQRSSRLLDLSERLRDLVGDDALGAIVPPPVQLEDVNPRFWPRFPWRRLEPLYDAWMTMGYWTDRRPESGHREGYGYTVDNVRRLRERLGDDDALVHPIGGIGDAATAEDLAGYADALAETDAAGGSVYDWVTLDGPKRTQLARSLGDGAGGDPQEG